MFQYSNNLDLYLSILKSLSLILYLLISGKYISKKFGLIEWSNEFRFFHVIVSYVFHSILINYLIFFNFNFKDYLNIFLYIIIFSTILYSFYFFFKKRFKIDIPKNNFSRFIYLVLVLYFFLSLAPITSADSLDYHLGVPLSIFKYGKVFDPLWFHSGLAGISDYFLIISISFKAEQLGNLIQYFALLSIIELYWIGKGNKSINNINLFISLVITIPVILFLTSSPKPQLGSIAIAIIIFFLLLTTKELKFRIFVLLSILIIYLSLTKINFILTAFFLSLSLLLKIDKRKIFLYAIVFIFIFLFLYFPLIVYKLKIPNSNFLDILLPIPHKFPGLITFLVYLRTYNESIFPFPFSLIFPSSLGNFTTILGVNLIILLYFYFKSKIVYNPNFFIIIIYLVLNMFLGQKTSRFFLEIYLFLLLYYFHYGNPININLKFFYYFQFIQLIIFSIILFYCFFNLTIGNINLKNRESVLNKNANGYKLATWVNSLLPASSKLLLEHRSVTLFKQKIYSTDWSYYVNNTESSFYDSIIKKNQLNYILILNDTPQNSRLYKYCSKLKYGPFKDTSLNRNPFRAKIIKKAWIYEAIK